MIRVGVAGWDYPDWEGPVYPSPPPSRFDRRVFLAPFFDLIELNVTFYRQPDPAAARSWIERLAAYPQFRFTAKLYRAFTHPTWGSRRRPAAPVDLDREAERFIDGIAPLRDAGRLGAVLAQFPHAFHDQETNRAHVRRLKSCLAGLPLVAEFRHRSWGHEDALRFLHQIGIGFCNIDQPAIGTSLGATGHVTTPLAYIRLHGRNAANWFRRGASTAQRYDYLYSMEELRPWVERAQRLDERAEEVFIVANNHFRGQAPANALMLKSALTRTRVAAPADLVDAFPVLKQVAIPIRARGSKQRTLFD